jgi:hypothetical protein
MFSVNLEDRGFNRVTVLPDVQFRPLRWGSTAVGGPEYAIVEVYGAEAALWQCLDWLRYHLIIRNEMVAPIWWGYVESISLDTPSVSVSVSLEDMANSIAVEYGDANTGFSEDAASIAEYGRKQRVLSVDPVLTNTVSQRQSAELATRQQPQPVQDIRRNEQAVATLRCVGWLKTLSWLYYSRDYGLVEYVGNGSTDQVFGLGVSDNEFWFVAESREIHDTGMNLYKFERGQRLAVSGSTSNNTTFTVSRPTTSGPAGLTISHQLNFVASNKTIYRYGTTGPNELAWIAKGDRLHITGTTNNNGWFQVTGISSSWADMWISVSESLTNEVATNPVLWRGHSIGLEEQPTEEKPGASVTIYVDNDGVAQQFTPANGWEISTVALKLKKVGSPADNVEITINSNSGGAPVFPALATASVGAASVSANQSTWTEFTLSTPLAVTGGTTYWVVVGRSGAEDPSNYYAVAVDENAGYGGLLRMWDGSSWVARVVDASMLFRIEGVEVTTDQITEIVTGAGQFLTGTTIEDASGLETLQYRDGIVDALTELGDLLAIGTSNGKRLLCQVESSRNLRVFEEATYSGTPDYIRRLDGTISTPLGVPLAPGASIEGSWLRVETPLLPSWSRNVDATLLFVERCEYDSVSMAYNITPRGAPNIWRLAVAPST